MVIMMPEILCTRWIPAVKNSRQGFCDLTIPAAGLTIKGAVLNSTASRRWISWPAVETGRGYASCFCFTATVDREQWQAAAVQAIDEFCAGADAGGHELPVLL
jgi:hypothetical protein